MSVGVVCIWSIACAESATQCSRDSDCESGEVCLREQCWVPQLDASAPLDAATADRAQPELDAAGPGNDATTPSDANAPDANVVMDAGEDDASSDSCVVSDETCNDEDDDCDGDVDEGLWQCATCTGNQCTPPRYPGPCTLDGDLGTDNTVDRRWTYTYRSDDNKLVQTDFDANLDEIMDRRTRYTYSAQGSSTGDLRYDADMNLTGRATYINEGGRRVRIDYDLDNNSEIDRVAHFLYSGGLLMRQDIDLLADGSIDQEWTYWYDDDNLRTRSERRQGGPVDYQIFYFYDERRHPTRLDIDTNFDGAIDERRTYDYSCWGW